MALPTAPLGQLPSMNMPYQIPTYEVTRGRDRALQALAMGIAQALGQGVVSNVMSRDYAEPGAKAGFWSKLVQGPKVTEGQFKDQIAREHSDIIQARDIAAKQGLADQQIVFETGRDQARSLSDFQKQIQEEYLADKDRQSRERLSAEEINARLDLEKLRNTNEGSRLDKSINANLRLEDRRSANDTANNLARARLQQAAELEQIGARATAEGQTPQGRYYDQQAAMLAAQNQLLQERLGGGPRNQGSGVDPTVVEAAKTFLQNKPTQLSGREIYNQTLQRADVRPEILVPTPQTRQTTEYVIPPEAQGYLVPTESVPVLSPEQQAVADFLATQAQRDPSLNPRPDAITEYLSNFLSPLRGSGKKFNMNAPANY